MTEAEILMRVATLDERSEQQAEALERGRERMQGHDERIRSLEHWRWWVAGGFAFLAFEIPIALALMLRWGH